jgi:flagellar biosynthesis protein FlhF
MESYQRQKRPGATIFRAKNIKEAMGGARMAFGPDVEVLSVEKVGGAYCVEVRPPADDSAPMGEQRQGPSAAAAQVAERFGEGLDAVDAVERRFQELAAQMGPDVGARPATGMAASGSVRLGLAQAGFAEPFVGKLAGAMMDAGASSYDKSLAMRVIASWLGQVGQAPDLDGGWHAIVGPAGSGKTTTIAKLATRAAAKHGPDAVGLISTDFFRIGAYEQLKTFGELLGIPVHPARSIQELRSLRQSMAGKKVVYVDSVGSSRDDERMREQMAMFSELDIRSCMAVQACLDRLVLRADVGRWKEAGATSALITKMDQAMGVAPLVETLIMRAMPVLYATTGQRVPADLHKVSPLLLAHKALRDESGGL